MGYSHYMLAKAGQRKGAIDAFRTQREDVRRTFLPLFSQAVRLPMPVRSAVLSVQLCPHQHG